MSLSAVDLLEQTWVKKTSEKTPFLMKIEAANPNVLEIFEGDSLNEVSSARDLERQCEQLGTQCFILPYSAVKQAGGCAVDDELYPSFFTANSQLSIEITDQDRYRALQISQTSNSKVKFASRESDEDYAELIHYAKETLIQSGEGCNFVFRRDYDAVFPQDRAIAEAAFTCFLSVFASNSVPYWNFAWFDGEMFVIGSSPESVISLSGGIVKMTPISGTFRKEDDRRTLEDFLNDEKEIFELDMVLDEELKIMSKLCESEITVEGPNLIDSGRVLHTGFTVNGKLSTSVGRALLSSLGPPTVVGSPLSTAQKHVILREKDSRGFYAGTCGIIHNSRESETRLESALIIRCLELGISSNIGKIRAGATIVRDSNTVEELSEVAAKAVSTAESVGISSSNTCDIETVQRVSENGELINQRPVVYSAEVKSILSKRSKRLPSIWRGKPTCSFRHDLSAEGQNIILVECGDDFIWMIAYILRKNGYNTSVVNWKSNISLLQGKDCLVLGPGPGDPRLNDERAEAIRMWESGARELNIGTIAVCLSHQILSKSLGYSLKQIPGSVSQGKQREFQLGVNRKQKFAAYNSYQVVCDGFLKPLDYIKGLGFRSFQFHPESILSESGEEFLLKEVAEVIREASDFSQIERALRITLWKVTEDELPKLDHQTRMQARLWWFVEGLFRKTWIISDDKKYWGAITETSRRAKIDYSLLINVGKQIIGRNPDIDTTFEVSQYVEPKGSYVS